MKRSWVQLRDFPNARVLLILPCNAAASVGNYFRAEVYRKAGWNTWRGADLLLRDLRKAGRVAFAAVDSSTLETAPDDPRGAIVLETEMHRARNPEGQDWGAPSWRWFRPIPAGRWTQLEVLTEALTKGVRRVEALGFSQVLALVNPRAYFLALAAAAGKCGVLDLWVLFRTPAHPRYLLPAVRQVVPFVQAAAAGGHLRGGIYPIPDLYPMLRREGEAYRNPLSAPQYTHTDLWRRRDGLPSAVADKSTLFPRRRLVMAIDKNKAKRLIKDIDKAFESMLDRLNPQIQQFVKERILDPALAEFRELIIDSSPPSLFLSTAGHKFGDVFIGHCRSH